MPEIEVTCELEVVTHVTGPTDATAMEPDAVVGDSGVLLILVALVVLVAIMVLLVLVAS